MGQKNELIISFCLTILCKPRPSKVCLRVRKVLLVIPNFISLVKDTVICSVDSEVRWWLFFGEKKGLKNSLRSLGVDLRRFFKLSMVGSHGKLLASSV